jgi:hypothetical protein
LPKCFPRGKGERPFRPASGQVRERCRPTLRTEISVLQSQFDWIAYGMPSASYRGGFDLDPGYLLEGRIDHGDDNELPGTIGISEQARPRRRYIQMLGRRGPPCEGRRTSQMSGSATVSLPERACRFPKGVRWRRSTIGRLREACVARDAQAARVNDFARAHRMRCKRRRYAHGNDR